MISMEGDLALTVVALDVQRMLWASHGCCVDQKMRPHSVHMESFLSCRSLRGSLWEGRDVQLFIDLVRPLSWIVLPFEYLQLCLLCWSKNLLLVQHNYKPLQHCPCCSMTYVCAYTKYNPFLFSVEGGTGRHSSKQAIQSGTGGGGRQGWGGGGGGTECFVDTETEAKSELHAPPVVVLFE